MPKKQRAQIFDINRQAISGRDAVYILGLVISVAVAAASLWFATSGKIAAHDTSIVTLTEYYKQVNSKQDNIIERLARIEGALGVKGQSLNRSENPLSNATPAQQSLPIMINAAPASSGSSATFRQPASSSPIISTPSDNVGGAVDVLKSTTDGLFDRLPILN